MARLIWKTDFIDTRKSKKSKATGSLKYIGQRSGVELNNEKKPSLTQLEEIKTILKSFNESEFKAIERKQLYKKFDAQPSVKTANDLLHFLNDVSEKKQQYANDSVGYLRYIGRRKGVELNEKDNPSRNEHGLFDTKGAVDFEQYKTELENHEGLVFRHIISLKQEDAQKCGLVNQKSWVDLLNKKFMEDLSKEMKINYTDLRWVGAYHNKEDNPHVHLMVWDKNGGGCFYKENIERMKSKIVNVIYKEDRKLIYDKQLQARNEFRDIVLNEMKYIVGRNKTVTEKDEKEILSELEKLSKMIPNDSKLKYQHLKNNKHHMPKLQQLNKVMELIFTNDRYSDVINSYVQSKVDLASFYKDGNYSEEEKKAIGELKERVANIIIDSAKQLNNKNYSNLHLISHLKFIEKDLKNVQLNLNGLDFDSENKKNIFIDKTIYEYMKVCKILKKSDQVIKQDVLNLLTRSNLKIDDGRLQKLFQRLEKEIATAKEYKADIIINKKQFNNLACNLDLPVYENLYEPQPITISDVVNKIGFEMNRAIKQNEYLKSKEQRELAKLRRKNKGKRKGREMYGSKYQTQER